jgi:hypothetical protein
MAHPREDHGKAGFVGRGDDPGAPESAWCRKQTSDEGYGTDGEIAIVGEIVRLVELGIGNQAILMRMCRV